MSYVAANLFTFFGNRPFILSSSVSLFNWLTTFVCHKGTLWLPLSYSGRLLLKSLPELKFMSGCPSMKYHLI